MAICQCEESEPKRDSGEHNDKPINKIKKRKNDKKKKSKIWRCAKIHLQALTHGICCRTKEYKYNAHLTELAILDTIHPAFSQDLERSPAAKPRF
jgi:hypothetical protein